MDDNLKFRKWDKESKTMSDVEVLDLRPGQTYTDNPVIMQSTGLKDINSKEIFEGDILKLTSAANYDEEKYVEVKYSSQYGAFIVLPSKEYLSEGLYAVYGKDGFYHEYPKIVGNIYQNLELINLF